jgi:carbon-monoxide dehydrogenase small subunit
MNQTIQFTLNGHQVTVAHVRGTLSLLELLRQNLGITSARVGCMTGDCGCCNVHLDGEVVPACLVLAPMVEGRTVTTVESLGQEIHALSPLQQAFYENLAVQCGYCTSGQLMSAAALLAENPHPTRAEVKRWMAGNLCRCTGYYKIITAVLAAADTPASDGRALPETTD